jgi:glycosyltransferase involved in cell wall biosynthesis
MRLLQVHNRYRLAGGEDTVVEAEAALLRTAGHIVERYERFNPEHSAASGAQMLMSPWNPASAARAKRAAREFDADVVHVHNTWFSLTSSIFPALAREGAPIVMTLHNYRMTCVNAKLLRDGAPCDLCVGASKRPGIRYRCYRDSYTASAIATLANTVRSATSAWEHVSRFVALTEFARQVFVRAGLDPGRIVVKPNFSPDPGPRAAPPSKSHDVLFVGRVESEKGVDVLLESWKRSAPPGLRLQIVGDGPLRGLLQRQYPDVDFLGWVNSSLVRRKMLQARALVFPSRSFEGQSMVILEAMAAGLPVMASDWPPIRETTKTELGRWLREPGDIDSWTEGLEIITDDSAVDAEGVAARNTYKASHTPSQALRNLESIYRSVMGVPKESDSGSLHPHVQEPSDRSDT